MAMTDNERKEFKEIITDGFKTQREWLEATLHPIRKDVDKHAVIIDKVPIIEQKIDTHIQNHISTKNDKKFNVEMWIMVAIFLLGNVAMYFKG